ncbi:MAG: ribose 5-phosphate isomerase B [Paludibacteraceae bacterium]|nr:ribose 5-phosphate isomerase B [Paludibacteraceae bacterium]
MSSLRIALASDHAGYALKQHVINYLQQAGVGKLHDFGCHSAESCDYPDFAHPLADAVEAGQYDFGITICGSGNGISMTVNKHQGIRAALCWLPELGRLARQHNNANILSLPARFITPDTATDIVRDFLQADFEGGRHQRRIDKIAR